MNPKKLIVPVLCVLLGCAGGAAMGSVTAQTWPQPSNVQRWQQECENVLSYNSDDRRIRDINDAMRRRGAEGWEFAGNPLMSDDVLCFKRPAP